MKPAAYFEKQIRDDFAAVLSFKHDGETLEVVTPFVFPSGDVVSVYVERRGDPVERRGGYIAAAVWIPKRYLMGRKKIRAALMEKFGVQESKSPNWFFKTTTREEMVSACVFDAAMFGMALGYATRRFEHAAGCDDEEFWNTREMP